MGLNVKAAVVVCLGFVSGLSWLLHGTAPPPVTVRSPLVARTDDGRRLARRSANNPRVASDALAAASRADGLARPASAERVAATRRAVAETLRFVPPASNPRADDVRLASALVLDDPWAPRPDSVVAGHVARHQPEGPALPSADAGVTANGAQSAADQEGPVDEPRTGVPRLHAYRVARGDTLMRIIAKTFGSQDERLLELVLETNPRIKQRPGRILVGEVIQLPDERVARRVLRGELGPRAAAEQVRAAAEYGPTTSGYRWYTIQRNDSLTKIAKRFLRDGSRWREILELNAKLDPDRIFPGVRIRLPAVVRVASS